MLYKFLRASDGTGPAVIATIQSNRAVSATVIDVDSVDNWPQDFIVTTGTLGANGYILEATKTEMRAHLNAGDIIIDGFEPGFTDLGNTIGQKAVIKPATGWADSVVTNALVAHNDDGTIKNDAISSELMFTDNVDPVKRMTELMFDHVASGLVWTGDSYGVNRAASMTAGVVYLAGKRVTVVAIVSRVFTASVDTYIDVDNAGTVFYTEVANNAASPALTAGRIRIGIIITAAGSIAAVGSVNQGQENKLLPITSNVTYTVQDSLGNLICPRDPQRKLLGYRRYTTNQATASDPAVQATGMVCPVIVPTGRKILGTLQSLSASYNDTAGGGINFSIWRGTVGSGTNVAGAADEETSSGSARMLRAQDVDTPDTASVTYNGAINRSGGGTVQTNVGLVMRVELI